MSEVDANGGAVIVLLPFYIGQRVRIDAIDVVGSVKRITMARTLTEFQVRYFDDDKCAREEWFESSEISPA